jgi:hypothetical protein
MYTPSSHCELLPLFSLGLQHTRIERGLRCPKRDIPENGLSLLGLILAAVAPLNEIGDCRATPPRRALLTTSAANDVVPNLQASR